MAGEGEVRQTAADPGVKVFDIGGAGLAEGDAVHLETGALEELFDHAERARIRRSDRGAAQQIAGDGDGIGHHPASTAAQRMLALTNDRFMTAYIGRTMSRVNASGREEGLISRPYKHARRR